ncbi:hypothetical protein E2C01_075051 [Portunus trituberculatus]|uniref:Uncharacterized protein n=1 Tax=Portunus trituberculatus TaxID=210409 RepID=A0A5B7I519_PORTR|nr:hypothetical protein [Portunus trituberculatus]
MKILALLKGVSSLARREGCVAVPYTASLPARYCGVIPSITCRLTTLVSQGAFQGHRVSRRIMGREVTNGNVLNSELFISWGFKGRGSHRRTIGEAAALFQ